MTDETPDQRWERLSKDRVDRPLPRRFYKIVTVGDDLSILLDGRAVKTPLKVKLQLPNGALAVAIAAEWDAQEKLINPASMPLTKLANTAIDRATAERAHIAAEIEAFAANDLLCYRAEAPAALVALQDQHWNPVLEWAQTKLGTGFKTVQGIVHVDQPPETLVAVKAQVAGLDAFQLTLTQNLTSLTGSASLALMLLARAITPEAAWAAAHVDEDFQINQWGEDFEAAKRRQNRKVEFDATVRFLMLLGQGAMTIL
jgi:chaperone required for assembly of F1-ATPase